FEEYRLGAVRERVVYWSLVFVMISDPARSTLFPYTTLFRSLLGRAIGRQAGVRVGRDVLRRQRLWQLDQRALSGQQILRVAAIRSEEHTSELQSRSDIVCRLLLEKKKQCALNYT